MLGEAASVFIVAAAAQDGQARSVALVAPLTRLTSKKPMGSYSRGREDHVPLQPAPPPRPPARRRAFGPQGGEGLHRRGGPARGGGARSVLHDRGDPPLSEARADRAGSQASRTAPDRRAQARRDDRLGARLDLGRGDLARNSRDRAFSPRHFLVGIGGIVGIASRGAAE